MDFSKATSLLKQRKIDRRRAFQGGAAGIAAAGLTAAGLNKASAQDGTPDAADPGKKIEYLFVQSFEGGSIEARDAEAGTYTLSLQHGLGQTIYFSDRPERIVGASPTGLFLDALGFKPDNPPNAALVISDEAGNTDVAVIELTNPVYDAESATATYDIALLENFSDSDLVFQPDPADLSAIAASFGAAHLLIDDCHDDEVWCKHLDPRGKENRRVFLEEDGSRYMPVNGFCYQAWLPQCKPCDDVRWKCYDLFPDFCNQVTECEVDYTGFG